MIRKIMNEMADCKSAMEVGKDLCFSDEKIAWFKGKYEAYRNVLKMMGCNVEERYTEDCLALMVKVDRHDPVPVPDSMRDLDPVTDFRKKY